MSFFRPEAVDAIRRWAEPVVYAVVSIVGLWRGLHLIQEGAWVGVVIFVIGLFAAFGLFGTVERAIVAWRGRRHDPGVVSIHEGQISYFGPEGGAILALDGLVRVEIITTGAGPVVPDLFWQLTDEIGQIALIPGGAKDITALLDRLGGLPGFDHLAVLSAMGSTEDARFKIWSRPQKGQISV